MASGDLFHDWLPALWTKARPDGQPPTYVMHRFLASDPELAYVARELQRELGEPAIIFRTWQGLLPKGSGAPRLSYVAPKKTAAEEELVAKIMEAERIRREVAEEMLTALEALGLISEAAAYYGVENKETV